MIHYHGTPITPKTTYAILGGRHFCVSFADPRDIRLVHQIGQSVMIDNGAFTYWKRNPVQSTARDWSSYYGFVREWLDFPTSWAVIPDVIDGTEEQNDALIREWLDKVGIHDSHAAPVWHIHESFDRLEYLIAGWPRVCFGSSERFAQIGTPAWNNRMNETFNHICRGSGVVPAWIHMLRGMSLSGSIYPFASVDSTDLARNHHDYGRQPNVVADQWDVLQCPSRWTPQPIQALLETV